ncbi:CubicO group peptidase (beta-lactamase class C family) [Microbacterium natoriense]|uniref:CubicO group peptidase (Beta-lactamase class C family) n=1 Tax=Microbacterium natoriense TaxID=284570 RepID=A0AAW8EYL3_9MICO|nr:serine hydrolase [Microbacterium natoriense]MDQ0648613.1 CubicO group peptidase (beta-lactamase class C family) [Microbacterium natoriense]
MSAAKRVITHIVEKIAAEELGAYGVHVLVGDDEAEHRWRSDDRENLYSVSKGVSVLAAGIAVGEGLIALDTHVVDALPNMQLGKGVESVTLRHLLTMTSGIDFEWFGDQIVPWGDLAQEMLRRETRGPGGCFQYSDASTYVAMRMLGARVGDVRDWLIPRLFEPLDIHNPQWHRCPLGWIVGGSGLELRTHELARIGRLLRDRGDWNGKGIVASEWIDSMHEDWFLTGGPALWGSYGMGVWKGPGNGWRLDGAYGQYVYVSEAHDAVVTITAHEESHDHRLVEIAAEALFS